MIDKKFFRILIITFICHWILSICFYYLFKFFELEKMKEAKQTMEIFFVIFNTPLCLISKSLDFLQLDKEFLFLTLFPASAITYGILIAIIYKGMDFKQKQTIKIKKGFE